MSTVPCCWTCACCKTLPPSLVKSKQPWPLPGASLLYPLLLFSAPLHHQQACCCSKGEHIEWCTCSLEVVQTISFHACLTSCHSTCPLCTANPSCSIETVVLIVCSPNCRFWHHLHPIQYTPHACSKVIIVRQYQCRCPLQNTLLYQVLNKCSATWYCF